MPTWGNRRTLGVGAISGDEAACLGEPSGSYCGSVETVDASTEHEGIT